MFTKKVKGFTLIELLVVIAIIGILSSIVLVSVNSARNKAKDAAIKSNVEGTRVAAELTYDTDGNYGNVCAKPDFTRIAAAVATQGGTYNCWNNASGYCAKSNLSSGNWCADSTGYSGSTATNCVNNTAAGVVCQ